MGTKDEEIVKSHSNEEKKETLLQKYDIPINHLSFEYVAECKDGKKLEKIVKILRSGEEGIYPELTKLAEERLAEVSPQSRELKTPDPVLSRFMLDPEQRKAIDGELDDWTKEMRMLNMDLDEERNDNQREPLPRPAVRQDVSSNETSKSLKQNKKEKKLTSCDYDGWDKYDVDTEINRIELSDECERVRAKKIQEKRKADSKITSKENIIKNSVLTGTELSVMALREREKGNEAFRAKDYAEALKLYTDSITMEGDLASYNNRAMTYIKLKRYAKALEDCKVVLGIDRLNLKALLRRALAYEHLDKTKEAIQDYEAALQVDPMNSIAITAINRLKKHDDDQPVRLTIEEIFDD